MNKPGSLPTTQQLDGLAEHVAYELAALELADRRWIGDRLAFEAFLLHARALRSFFWDRWDPTARDADSALLAEHYFSDPTVWHKAQGGLPAALGRTKRALDKQLAHIARERIDPSFARDLEKDMAQIRAELERGWAAFLITLGADPRRNAFESALKDWRKNLGLTSV